MQKVSEMTNNQRGIGMTSQRTRDRLVNRLRDEGIKDPSVLQAVRDVPRHLFVDEALASRAYEDTALPIGHGQTISQPFIVARMTEALLSGEHRIRKVLEVGTGSGYQAAILAQLVEKVFSVERIELLLQQARERFFKLGIRNVRLKHSDGSWGWPDHGPYDGIIVTAAPEAVPPDLLEQLAVGGRLVIPVGASGGVQILKMYTRTSSGYELEELNAVSFVPMIKGGV